MEDKRLETKVGVFIALAVASVLTLLWLMGELSLGSTLKLAVDFGHAGNVVKGAPVKLGGVAVGHVDKILLRPDNRDETGRPLPVRMELSIEPNVRSKLHTDAMVTVATQGPLGESYLELSQGSVSTPLLPNNTVIRGLDPFRLDLVANRLANFLEAASEILENDPRAFVNLVDGVSKLTRTANGVLDENRESLRIVITELASAAKDFRALSAQAKTTFAPNGNGSRLIDDAAETAAFMRRELPPLSKQASNTLERFAAAGEKLDRLADRGDKILAQLEAGQGTAGAALKDPQLYEDLKELIKDLRKHPWKMLWKD